MTYEALLTEALRLPATQRDRLRLELDLSLASADAEMDLSPAHRRLIEERIAEYEANPDAVIPQEEAMQLARERLEAHRAAREEAGTASR